jgi:excisionase family DNA binding protein
MNDTDSLSPILGNDVAAAYIGCTPSTLRSWVAERRVPFIRVGRLVRLRRSDLDDFLESNLVRPEPDANPNRTRP